jgi:hypothetical protein
MQRPLLSLAVLSLLLLLAACTGGPGISQEEVATTPTVYATVNKAPNPMLMGHWRRPNPEGIEKPWLFHYWLVKRGDKYAVYYEYDSRRKNAFSGWAPFTINGDSMLCGVDGATFSVENGQVVMRVAGRDTVYSMDKVGD